MYYWRCSWHILQQAGSNSSNKWTFARTQNCMIRNLNFSIFSKRKHLQKKHQKHGAEIWAAPPRGFDQGGLGHQGAFYRFLHQGSCQVNCRQPLGAPEKAERRLGQLDQVGSHLLSFSYIYDNKIIDNIIICYSKNNSYLQAIYHQLMFLNVILSLNMLHYHIRVPSFCSFWWKTKTSAPRCRLRTEAGQLGSLGSLGTCYSCSNMHSKRGSPSAALLLPALANPIVVMCNIRQPRGKRL